MVDCFERVGYDKIYNICLSHEFHTFWKTISLVIFFSTYSYQRIFHMMLWYSTYLGTVVMIWFVSSSVIVLTVLRSPPRHTRMKGNAPQHNDLPWATDKNWRTNSKWRKRQWRTCSKVLTHWGRVTHTCIGKITIIDSDNGLSPGCGQAIIWTNGGILLIGPLGTTSVKFLLQTKQFHSRKCIWKCYLENFGHFVSASMC